ICPTLVRLWDIDTGAELGCFEGHAGGVTALGLLAGGRHALSGSSIDHTLRLWKLDAAAEQHPFGGHIGKITAVALLPDGKHVLSGSDDRTPRLWDLDTGKEQRRFEGHRKGIVTRPWIRCRRGASGLAV